MFSRRRKRERHQLHHEQMARSRTETVGTSCIISGMLVEWTVTTHSAAETQALAERLAERLIAGDVLWLSGDLGAGKTTFSQGLGRGLGIHVPINSPTFVLIREYSARLPLYHIDLYRLDNPRDVAALGLNDYLNGDGVCAIEWAERLVGVDGGDEGLWAGLHVRIDPRGEAARELHFSAVGARAEHVLAEWKQSEEAHAASH
jgi:tRNA threonylcarbamoyladenosine biosynthesis protein TsaE